MNGNNNALADWMQNRD